uniref:Carboxylic ester hydrolase n=1 Tax=Cnaphalocrocis medinalis TaxID=437488 RepID=A0A0C5C585_CNAME|nr:carboxylesterase [Cnaphalocrocis medinalis]
MFSLKAVLLCVVCYTLAPSLGQTSDTAEPSRTPQDGPVTVSPSGQFRGSWMTSRRGRQFQAYRGIRYAQPPVGELRFQPPKLIETYPEEVDASEDGPACPLLAPPGTPLDEDCLNVNVYTPNNNSSKPLPVIVFIHPGGFYSFSSRSNVFGPHYLLDKDVVLVTINYRLGTLGFLSTGDELAPGNNGFKDQVAALRWVRRNIRAFGGDPELVTLTGYSAGSTSVVLHMMSPMSKGLFHRAISNSASPVGKEPLGQDLYSLAVRQAEILNCPTDNSTVIVACLKTKPWQELGRSLLGFYEFGYDPVTIWKPIVEKDFGQERFLDVQPEDAIRGGKLLTPVPHIVSQTTDEFFWKAFTVLKNDTLLKQMNENWNRIAPISFQLPRENASIPAERLRQVYLGGRALVRGDVTSARGLGKLYGDSIVGFRVHRLANLMSRHSPHKVFYYEFSYIGNHSFYEDPETSRPTGAAHHDDLLYLFSIGFRFPLVPADGSQDSVMVDRMTGLWYNFARFGDPNPRGADQPELSSVHWPAMTPQERQYLRIGDQLTVQAKLGEDRFRVWEELYPMEY